MRALVQHSTTAARLLFGLVFFVFGLNGFLHFLPQPPPEGDAGIFFTGMLAGGWFIPLLKGVEVIAGLFLLGNRFVPLALAALAPIVVGILAFHAFLAPDTMAMAIVLLVLELALAYAYRDAFAPMLRARVTPHVAAEDPREPVGVPSRA